jgi:thiol-disulfide isomerase/thioredoxin
MKFIASVCFILFSFSGYTQNAEIVKLTRIEQLLEAHSDKIQVINFWATWCAPCVKELPIFEKLNAEGRPDVKVTLISMDLDLDPDAEKVYKFIARKKIQSDVLLLDEREPDLWINKISEEWSGALPATLIVDSRTGRRKFIERELKDGELEKIIAGFKVNSQ